jgi:hypothetical protein
MTQHLSRREALALAAGVPALPGGVAPGVSALLRSLLAREPSSFNTDWFGNMPVYGMLLWARRGAPEARPFAARWLDWHLRAATVAKYSGARSRQVMAGGLPLTTYAGHFGAALPCLEMALQRAARARQVCLDLGRIVLHEVSRNRFGLVNHDDFSEFAIPDTCYFAVTALMAAAALDAPEAKALRDQSVFQLQALYADFSDGGHRAGEKEVLQSWASRAEAGLIGWRNVPTTPAAVQMAPLRADDHYLCGGLVSALFPLLSGCRGTPD